MLAQPLYINNMASIHPAFTKKEEGEEIIWEPGKQLIANEPDYKELIRNAGIRRRMSRIIRMGVAAGLQCLANGSGRPDAILTATGLGCLTDTEKFMNYLLDMDEELLPPTPFIQSTFNTIGAQIALLTNTHSYNNTYVHRAFSFESALLDASLLISEGEATQVLAGAVDELNPTLYKILERFGCRKHAPAGEGAAFFLLSDKQSENAFAIIQDMETFSGSCTEDEIKKRMGRFLANNNVTEAPVFYPKDYKQYCGEYPTAMAFAIWYACKYPELSYSMIYNSFLDHHSFVLIKQI